VRGGTEPIESEALAVIGLAECPPSDQAGAEQGRQRRVVPGFAKREGVARIGDNRRGVAAVTCVAGEERAVAEIFGIHQAIGAGAACMAKPRYADALTDPKRIDASAKGIDAADDLVTGDDRK